MRARVGDPAPKIAGRTDEGTPLALADLAGRALAVFALGGPVDAPRLGTLAALAERTGDFLDRAHSPVALLAGPQPVLASIRDDLDPPFLCLADPRGAIHRALGGPEGARLGGVWLFGEDGRVSAALPRLGTDELLKAVLAAVERVRS